MGLLDNILCDVPLSNIHILKHGHRTSFHCVIDVDF